MNFEVILGPSSCADRPEAVAVVTVRSTSDGQARSISAAASCTEDDATEAMRRAWSATAAAG